MPNTSTTSMGADAADPAATTWGFTALCASHHNPISAQRRAGEPVQLRPLPPAALDLNERGVVYFKHRQPKPPEPERGSLACSCCRALRSSLRWRFSLRR